MYNGEDYKRFIRSKSRKTVKESVVVSVIYAFILSNVGGHLCV